MYIPRKPRTTKYVKKGSKGVRTSVGNAKPLRNRVNYKRQRTNRKFNLMGMGVMERKLSPVTQINEGVPQAIQIGSQAYQYQFNLGATTPSTWTGTWNALSGFTYSQGTSNNSRDGRYMFIDRSTINMSVHMNASERLYAPTQFRMIVFRARRATTPTGISYDPGETLFLRPNGDRFGSQTGGVNYNDLYLQPTNKRDWIIVCDKKFTLSSFLSDGTGNTAAWQGKYPNFKTMRVNLTHKKKTAFNNTANEPEDFDYHYGCVIFAGSVGRDQIANNWEVNLRGTTTALDN